MKRAIIVLLALACAPAGADESARLALVREVNQRAAEQAILREQVEELRAALIGATREAGACRERIVHVAGVLGACDRDRLTAEDAAAACGWGLGLAWPFDEIDAENAWLLRRSEQ